MNDQDVLRDAVYVFGPESQKKMLLEEMAELQKEICKQWRGADNMEAIADEMADVYIMLDQMMILFDNAEQVARHRREKTWRLAARVFEKKYPTQEAL